MTQVVNETVVVDETGTSAASLYVGELDAGVTEAMLFELFNIVGPVASIRVCRDAVTRRSLGYAYVNYHSRSDAERALDSLNYTDIKGRPCRIMWSQRDPALRKTGAGNIFIKNLHSSIDHKVLHDTFSAFGNILSCKVAMDGGVSRGYGFVHYETQEAAEAAIKAVNGMLLHNKQVYVGHHVPKKERETKTLEQKQKFTNVYVKNLDLSITSDDFKNMFARFGEITSAVVATDASTGESKGFGFVNFETHEAAAAAVTEMNDIDHHDKKLYVGRAQKKEEREAELKQQYEQAKAEKQNKYQGVNLYVKNLELDMDDEKLRAAFERFGPITSAKIMRDEKGDSKGFGFVCYTTPDDAAKAAADMNGRMLGTKPIYVALAQRKDVRKSQLEAQMAQRMRMPQMPFFYPSLGRGVFPQPVPRPRWPAMPFAAAAPIPAVGRAQQPPRPVVRQAKKKKDALSATALAAAPPGQQKQMLGEALFPLITQRQPEQAGKITGMLLEMDNAELLHLLEAPEALDAKIDEAVLVLKQHALAK